MSHGGVGSAKLNFSNSSASRPQDRGLRIERCIDQSVVGAVDLVVVVAVTVDPAADAGLRGNLLIDSRVNACIVSTVHDSIDIGVAVVGVYDEHRRVVDSDTVE